MGLSEGIAVGSAVVGVLAAAAGVFAAVYSRRQANAAKDQAEFARRQAKAAEDQVLVAKRQAEAGEEHLEAARHQVDLMRKQVEIAEQANKLAEAALVQEQEGKRFRLDLVGRAVEERGRWWLQVSVENNNSQPASIQEIEAVFTAGEPFRHVMYGGQIKLRTSGHLIPGTLPGRLEAGESFLFRFVRASQHGMGEDGPPDYSEQMWRGLKGVRLKANNRWFEVPEGDGHWLRQFREGAWAPN